VMVDCIGFSGLPDVMVNYIGSSVLPVVVD
jgi:hypothetical protein